MNAMLRSCGLVLAAGMICFCAPLHANPGRDDGDGPPATKPGDGRGNGGNGGDHGNSGDHAKGPPTTPPSSGPKVHGPQGTCTADSLGGIDLLGPEGQSGASHVAHTDFTLMDITTGDVVASASKATMMYFWYGSTFDFVLNAHQLPVGSEWTLTYQPEPLPSAGVVCLGSATVNGGGQLHLASSLELNSNLPPTLDPTGDPAAQPADVLFALVPTADVDCTAGTNTTFEPDVSLWSGPRIRFVDTDLLPAVQ